MIWGKNRCDKHREISWIIRVDSTIHRMGIWNTWTGYLSLKKIVFPFEDSNSAVIWPKHIFYFSILFLLMDLKMLTSVACQLSYRKNKCTFYLPVIPRGGLLRSLTWYTTASKHRKPDSVTRILLVFKGFIEVFLNDISELYLHCLAFQVMILFYGFSLDNIFSFNYLFNIEISIYAQIQ